MAGMHNTTGEALEGLDHLKQSIRDILTTPLGSRVMRRDYGSRLFELVDAPLNDETIIEVYAATAEALDRWEPRFLLRRVALTASAAGSAEIMVEGDYLPDGKAITLEGILT